jgi:hypothetical protein
METRIEIRPATPVPVEAQQLPLAMPVKVRQQPEMFKAWQRLPFVWRPPNSQPPHADDFRDWGINE